MAKLANGHAERSKWDLSEIFQIMKDTEGELSTSGPV